MTIQLSTTDKKEITQRVDDCFNYYKEQYRISKDIIKFDKNAHDKNISERSIGFNLQKHPNHKELRLDYTYNEQGATSIFSIDKDVLDTYIYNDDIDIVIKNLHDKLSMRLLSSISNTILSYLKETYVVNLRNDLYKFLEPYTNLRTNLKDELLFNKIDEWWESNQDINIEQLSEKTFQINLNDYNDQSEFIQNDLDGRDEYMSMTEEFEENSFQNIQRNRRTLLIPFDTNKCDLNAIDSPKIKMACAFLVYLQNEDTKIDYTHFEDNRLVLKKGKNDLSKVCDFIESMEINDDKLLVTFKDNKDKDIEFQGEFKALKAKEILKDTPLIPF